MSFWLRAMLILDGEAWIAVEGAASAAPAPAINACSAAQAKRVICTLRVQRACATIAAHLARAG
jgi:hypothetical protein